MVNRGVKIVQIGSKSLMHGVVFPEGHIWRFPPRFRRLVPPSGVGGSALLGGIPDGHADGDDEQGHGAHIHPVPAEIVDKRALPTGCAEEAN